MERTETEFREKEALNENGIQIKKEEEYSEFLALLNSSCEQQYVPPTCIYIKEEEIVTEDLVLKDPEDEEVDVENTEDHLPNGDTKTVEEFPHSMMEPLVQVDTQECKQEWDAEEVVESNDTAGGAVSCPECGLRLAAGASLSRHVLSHQLQRRLTCALCGQLCSSSVMLMRHLHSAHAVDMPPAGVPPASTPAEEAAAPPRRTKRPYVRRTAPVVAARVRSPGERQELRCSQCSKTFHSRSRLEAHERRHQEGGLFPCMYCPKCFTREGALKKHLLKHNGVEDIYEPVWFAYQLMESFLLPIYTSKSTLNSEMQSRSSETAVEEIVDEGEETENYLSLLSSSTSSTVSSQSTSTSEEKCSRTASNIAEQQMATAFTQLTNVLTQRQSCANAEEDECDLYAKLLAKKMRRLPEDDRKLMMYEIDGLFIKRIKQGSFSCETPSPRYSYQYSRPSSASNGCIVVPNRSAHAQTSFSEPSTPNHDPFHTKPISNFGRSSTPLPPSQPRNRKDTITVYSTKSNPSKPTSTISYTGI